MVPAMFALGYALQRFVIGRASHGKDENILLVTLGLAIVLENLALLPVQARTRAPSRPPTRSPPWTSLGAMIAVPKLVAFAGALAVCGGAAAAPGQAPTSAARSAPCAKERQGAKLVGIDVEHVFAMSFGIGLACLGAAACFLLPAYYVNPQVGNGFVLIAFTIVVLGGMGSFAGALAGGLLIGVVESLGGLWLGESLGQIGIFLIFIAVLLFRPQGLFGARA